jgi:shikimate dehydrogenase
MDHYAVAGNPVEHSRSPFIHARFARQTGQDLAYGRLLCPLDGFARTLLDFAANTQLGGPVRGCNVTVPFKFEAFQLAARRSERAELAQAANTLRFDTEAEGGWYADNTDGVGLVRDITVQAGVPLAGRDVLLLGAGGASAGVLGMLLQEKPARVVVANRTADKAQALVARHLSLASSLGVALSAAALDDCGERYDVVVNATAASLANAGVPVHARVLKPGALALDMMYGPAARGFLQWAAEHGAVGRDGLGMLVEQAAEAFFVWRGVRPQTKPVLDELRAMVDGGAS